MKKILTLFLIFIWMVLFTQTWDIDVSEEGCFWKYKMQKITIPVGNSENEIFVTKSSQQDMLDAGPTEFQIDVEGNIFILDQKQIKKFDASGNFLNSTQESDLVVHSFVVHDKLIWAICGNQKNEVFLRRFSEKCELIDTHQIANRKSSLEINQFGKVGLKLSYDRFLEFNFEDEKLETKEKKYFQDVIFSFSAVRNEQDIIFLKNNERIDIQNLWPQLNGFYFAGFDQDGNLYFELFAAGNDSEIGIISNEGDVYETNIELLNYNKFGLDFGKGIDCFISQIGTVYQMIPMKVKIEIRKWTRTE